MKESISSNVNAITSADDKSTDKATEQAASTSAPATIENKLNTPCGVPGVPTESENALATYLDIAVLRCLFISHWSEEGFFWALNFLNRR